MMEYGELVMSEGAAKETAKAAGVALSARFAEARELAFARNVVNLQVRQTRQDKREEAMIVARVEAARLAWEEARVEQDRLADGRQLARMEQQRLAGARAEKRIWGVTLSELVAEPTRKRRGGSASPPPAKKK